MKLAFPRSARVGPPEEIKPEPVALPTPLKVPPPEGRPWWIVVVAVGVIGLVVGVVVISFASGARTFNGGFALFPILDGGRGLGDAVGPARRWFAADVAGQDGFASGAVFVDARRAARAGGAGR